MKPKISLAIATFNEEKNLPACLESVKGLAEEIVVVDGSSTDKTVEIAKKYGAKVIVTANPPIFHINKQKAIDACQGDWILQLDADERVTTSLRDEIKNKILNIKNTNQKSKIDREVVAYYIPRKNYFLGRWLRKTGQYPDGVIRFFKKGKAYLPCKSVHEQMEVKGKVGWLKGHLLHYPYPSFSEYLKKSNRYTSLSAQEMIKAGKKPSVFAYFLAEWQAIKTFLLLFIRHKGFMDGFPGFVFSLYSGLHHISAYIKFWELYQQKRKIDIRRDWED
ncbi:MAG: glycosyltransferase family 2 protein [Microgenomates group bacterium]